LEDDRSAGEALAFVLRDWGAEVVVAANGRELTDAIGERVAQARWIIADYHLGDSLNGVTVARLISADAPNARVLVLTGSPSRSIEQEAARAGFKLLSKPVPADIILSWLQHI
jgi:CheY-like chemotaxis protein